MHTLRRQVKHYDIIWPEFLNYFKKMLYFFNRIKALDTERWKLSFGHKMNWFHYTHKSYFFPVFLFFYFWFKIRLIRYIDCAIRYVKLNNIFCIEIEILRLALQAWPVFLGGRRHISVPQADQVLFLQVVAWLSLQWRRNPAVRADSKTYQGGGATCELPQDGPGGA